MRSAGTNRTAVVAAPTRSLLTAPVQLAVEVSSIML